jgi:hypothetical protein
MLEQQWANLQGRIEVKIKILREMLQKFSDTCELCNTVLGWETLFAKISDHVDNLPIARGSASMTWAGKFIPRTD